MKLDDIPGFGPTLVRRVKAEYPDLLDDARLRKNPYLLTRVHGVGFRLADRVALARGMDKTASFRVNAAAVHVLGEAENIGHTCLPTGEFAEKLSAALGAALPSSLEFDEEQIVAENDFISKRSTEWAERVVAARVNKMRGDPNFGWLEADETGLKEDQIAALAQCCDRSIFALMGGPGVGKTFLVRRMVEGARELRVGLCAPTGKAARRIEELAGEPAQTIHRMLGVIHKDSPDFKRAPRAHSPSFKFHSRPDSPLPYDLVIVDESSMMETRLMADLCDALRPDARLVLVGDPFQLPAVGPGAVLRDLANAIPHMELTELKRQDPDLLIARNCQSIRFERRVQIDNAAASDFFFIQADDPRAAQAKIVEMVCDRLPAKYDLDPRRDVVTLTALREKGALSVKALNMALRARLNPDAVNSALPTVGDRVIQLTNSYGLDVMNGDIGTLLAIDDADYDINLPASITVQLDTPEREIRAERSEFNLDLAYALTVHKFQGSEAPAVVVAVHEEQGQMMTSAQWLYTAISRAKRVCVVVGSRRALDAMAARHRDERRWTRLGGFLKA